MISVHRAVGYLPRSGGKFGFCWQLARRFWGYSARRSRLFATFQDGSHGGSRDAFLLRNLIQRRPTGAHGDDFGKTHRRWRSTEAFALAPGPVEAGVDALPDELAFHLRHSTQNGEDHLSDGCAGVDGLAHRNE